MYINRSYSFLAVMAYMVSALLVSCEEDGDKPTVKAQVESNALKPLSGSEFVFVIDDAGKTFQNFSWSEPDFGFQASISYTLQAAVAGKNFKDAMDIVTTDTLNQTVTVGDFNKKLLDMGLDPESPVDIELRVASTINEHVAPVYTNVLKVNVTPYATSFPLIYMIGDALLGWDLAKAVEMRSTGVNQYAVVAEFHHAGAFRFFSAPDWDAPKQYNFVYFDGGTMDATLVNAGDGDKNLKFTGATSFIRIAVDLKKKEVTMKAVDKPTLVMIGDALEGWDLAKAVPLTWMRDSVFETTTNFTNGKIFRFFAKPDWSTGFGNYPYFTTDGAGTVSASFKNADDGDKNFFVVTATGSYKIAVDLHKPRAVTLAP